MFNEENTYVLAAATGGRFGSRAGFETTVQTVNDLVDYYVQQGQVLDNGADTVIFDPDAEEGSPMGEAALRRCLWDTILYHTALVGDRVTITFTSVHNGDCLSLYVNGEGPRERKNEIYFHGNREQVIAGMADTLARADEMLLSANWHAGHIDPLSFEERRAAMREVIEAQYRDIEERDEEHAKKTGSAPGSLYIVGFVEFTMDRQINYKHELLGHPLPFRPFVSAWTPSRNGEQLNVPMSFFPN